MGTVGTQLRQKREQRGLTVDAVTRATKLTRHVLTALEEDRFGDLAAPVYARGFIRIYGEFLELDPAELLGQLDVQQARREQLAAEMEAPAAAAGGLPDYMRQAQSKAPAITPATAVLLLATAAIVVVFAWSFGRKTKAAPLLAKPAVQMALPATATGPVEPPPAIGTGKALPPLPGRESSGRESPSRELPRR